MHPHEEAVKLARERLTAAEDALYTAASGMQRNPEHLHQLTQDVQAARREVLNLLARLWPEEK